VKKGDRVVIYMPMSVEGVVAMQACARIGATHSVVFGGFSSKSLQRTARRRGRRCAHHVRRTDARRQGTAAEEHRR
jgi:acyl-coenzyme A synthetase/AMP-(fatty) acid ligase